MDESYQFQYLDRTIQSLKDKKLLENLHKWNLDTSLKVMTFSFNEVFHPYNLSGFSKDFLIDSNVLKKINVLMTNPWSKDISLDEIKVKKINCSVTSMSFFDRLKDDGIVRPAGSICKCFDETFEGILIQDELRKMILSEDCINFESFSDDDRNELMFKLFKTFVIGGPICQYEDNVQPYLDITKSFYKDLVSVQKKSETDEIQVVSHAFQLSVQNEKGKTIFPSDEHEQTFALLVVDPVKRHVHFVYNHWGSSGVW